MKQLFLAAGIAAAMTLAACGKKEEPAPAAVAPTPAATLPVLRVAIDPTYQPFTFKTPEGKPTGFDIDIAEAICAEIKRQCEYVEQAWDSMIPGLQAQQYDVIISSMSITEERQQVIDFSDKYYSTPSRIVVKAGTPFESAASLKGVRLGVLKGSTQERYAMGELAPAGVEIVPYEAQDQVYLDIQSGRLAGTVADVVEVNAGFLSKPEGAGFGFVGPVLNDPKYFGTGMGVAMRKGQDELKQQINQAIQTIRANGTYQTIASKYFDFDIYGQ